MTADRRSILQVFNNPFANAARHAPESPPAGSHPFRNHPAGGVPAAQGRADPVHPRRGKLSRTLAVVDDPHTLRFIRDGLAGGGCAPILTDDPSDVQRIVRTERLQLVLLDLTLSVSASVSGHASSECTTAAPSANRHESRSATCEGGTMAYSHGNVTKSAHTVTYKEHRFA